MISDALKSSNSDEWSTPQDIYDQLDAEFHFTLDPAASEENHKTSEYFTREQDGLKCSWGGAQSILQPALQPDFEMGKESLGRGTEAEYAGRPDDPIENRHKVFPRLHPASERDPLHSRKS